MSAKRVKLYSVVGLLVGAGIAMLTLTQPWAMLGLHTSEFERDFSHSGGDTGTAIMGLAIATLAAAGALTIAGRLFRYVIGILTVGLGVGIAVAAGVGAADPAAGFGPEIRQFSGITDDAGVREIISQGTIATTSWSFIALAAGVVIAIVGIVALVTAHRWPGSARKYSRTRVEAVDESTEVIDDDRISQWDALSMGDDPTDSDSENQKGR